MSKWQYITNNAIKKVEQYQYINLYWSFILFFCVFAGWDTDYEHYYIIFNNIITDPISAFTTHLEIVYVWIINNLSFGEYSLFRLLIWGSAIFVLRLILKRLYIDDKLSVCVFLMFNLLYFSYARVSLSIVIFLFGFLLLYQNRGLHCNKIIGFILIIASLFFHKSTIFLLLLFPFSAINITKKKIILIILVTPVAYFIINHMLTTYIGLYDSSEGDIFKIQSAAVGYANNFDMTSGGSIIGMLITFMEYAAVCYALFVLWKYFQKESHYIKVVRYVYNLVIMIFYLSLILTFCNMGYIVIRRIILLTYLPLFICLSYYFKYNFRRKEFVFFSILSFSFSFLKICYYTYCQIIK